PHLASLPGLKAEIHVIARPDRASPAAGFWDLYMAEQEEIMRQAFGITGITMKERGEHYVR
ncbi:MAG TPA: hypothetical protein VKU38_11310, partial [Ktedonobacteraceae bacterium]|nr:hypothetical protein [Ktedonobacteraceae bacterium]